jgi:hypothetical protein
VSGLKTVARQVTCNQGRDARARKKPEPFAFAADLPDAYRELAGAIAAVVEMQERGPAPFIAEDAGNVAFLSESTIWMHGDVMIAAWERVAAASRRVHVAKVGPKDAVRRVGFVRSQQATR